MVKIEQEENGKKGRFVIYENEQFAGEMTYTWTDDTKIKIDHTGIGDAFGGKGYGKQLVMKAVEFAREKGIKIVPVCPFVKATFERDENIRDVRG
ncbi:GNAT family N-acetyltransferase [Parabacteroides sp. FAFU027]|uniref:GNAT family N-acetyltransferase n=1 Tax=Parabacteroides sp. FAFU027 TaxID=2922715 RepID=UPI001FB02B6F|nr:GNAT family N-acetyltransferase [Parabacteroides sp. FAFU027]